MIVYSLYWIIHNYYDRETDHVSDAYVSCSLYCEPILWPDQFAAYHIIGIGQLAVNGCVMDSLRQDTVLLVGPGEDPDVAVVCKLWEVKTELERQLWQRYITRCQGQQW